MIHLQWEKTASPERDAASPTGDAVSPVGDLLASPNFGICDTTRANFRLIKKKTKRIQNSPIKVMYITAEHMTESCPVLNSVYHIRHCTCQISRILRNDPEFAPIGCYS
jgi:hypothetical protein